MIIESELNKKIQIQMVKLIYSQLIVGLIGESFCAIGLFLGLWFGNYNPTILLIWLATNLIFCGAYRYCLYFYFLFKIKNNLTFEKMHLWVALFAVGVFFSGISWGFIGDVFVREGSLIYQILCIILLIGIIAAANPLYSPIRFIYAIFIILAFFPFISLMLAQQNVLSILGILGLVYVAFMLLVSNHYFHILQNSLFLQFKNEFLVKQTKHYADDLEKILILVRSTLESTTEGILVCGKEDKIENYNQKFLSMWQINTAFIKEKSIVYIFELMSSQLENADSFLELMQKRIIDPKKSMQGELKLKDKRVIEFNLEPLYVNDQDYGHVLSFRDISSRKFLEEELFHQANYDVLTGLPNRSLVLDRLSQAIRVAEKTNDLVGILFLDLDRFKVINDTLGHLVGDNLLKEVAKRLENTVEETDTVSREGGDEFLMILSKLGDENKAYEIANQILRNIIKPFFILGHKINMSISIGISFYPRNGNDPESLIKHADIAMYRAKELGRDNYQVFTEEMNEKAITRLMMENHLREAISLNELNLFYQPIVNLKTGEITAVESLLRWNHFKFNKIPIDEIISVAEESGLITWIGEWVFTAACRQLKIWENKNIKDLFITINISPQQFRQDHLLANIQQILSETQVNSKYICIEVTENVIMDNFSKGIDTLKQMRKLGMKIIIDDFGTGYSSLSYLRRLPVDKVKIDSSFIHGIPKNDDDVAIVDTILALAKNLKIKVIAEGVQTKQQVEFLKARGCDEIQGSFFSSAIDAENCTILLKSRKSLFEHIATNHKD